MAEIYTSQQEENLIDDLLRHGLHNSKRPKLAILRLALGLSMHMNTPPDIKWASATPKDGKPYKLERITGIKDSSRQKDYEKALKAMLSVYHEQDLFADSQLFVSWIRAHVHRGLDEISRSWRPGNDFVEYLLQEFSDVWQSDSVDAQVQQESGEQLKDALLEVGVTAKIVNVISGARVMRYVLSVEDIHHLDKLKKGLEKLAIIIGVNDGGIIFKRTNEPRKVTLDIPKEAKVWQQINGDALIDWARIQQVRNQYQVWLGKGVDGEAVTFELTDLPHLLVAGTTGSGKSVCLHSVIGSLLALNDKNAYQLALLDPKQVEFTQYQSLPNLFGGNVHINTVNCAACLEQLVKEMESRNALMASQKVHNIGELPEKDRPPLIFVFVEELADLVMQMGNAETHLIRLAQKARASGIHLILATQRPDARIFSGLLRFNIPARIAFRVLRQKESEIILDQRGAEKLLGKGDMLVKLPDSAGPVRAHGGFIKQSDLDYIQNNLMR